MRVTAFILSIILLFLGNNVMYAQEKIPDGTEEVSLTDVSHDQLQSKLKLVSKAIRPSRVGCYKHFAVSCKGIFHSKFSARLFVRYRSLLL
jgi:hypothetical protein